MIIVIIIIIIIIVLNCYYSLDLNLSCVIAIMTHLPDFSVGSEMK